MTLFEQFEATLTDSSATLSEATPGTPLKTQEDR